MMEPTEPEIRIVIVEDDKALSEIYKTRLEAIGYKCFVSGDGLEALSIIEKVRPQLVLLDIMIPSLGGDKVLQVMRSADWGKNIKVLVISNLNEAAAPPGIRALGIEDYLVKANLSNDQIDKIVDNILKPIGQTDDVNALDN